MPRIPLYEPNQVSTTQLQTPRATPLPVGGGGFGKGLLDLAVVAEKMQDEVDTLRAEEAYNNWIKQRDDLAYGKDGAFSVKGANVFNRENGRSFVEEFTGKASTAAGAISQGLGNENQRQKFNRLAGTAIRSFGTSLSQHEAKEGEAWRKSVYEGVVNTEADNIGRFYDNPEERQASISRVLNNTRTFANSQGLQGEQADVAVKEAVSKMHGIVINRMLENGQATEAKKYYEDNSLAITEKDGAVMRKAIKADSDAIEAQNAVDNVIKGFGPDDDDEAFNLDAMAAEIRTMYKDKPDLQKVALAMLKERASERDYSIKQRDYQTVGGIWKQVLNGAKVADIQKSPEFKRLDGESQAKLLGQIDTHRGGGSEESVQAYAEFLKISENPEALAKMTDEEIYAKAGTLGNKLTRDLLKKRSELNDPTKIRDAKIDTEDFNMIAEKAGLKPYDPKKSESERAELGRIKYGFEQRIYAEQAAKKRQLTREEKMKVMQEEIDSKAMIKRSLFGVDRLSSDTTKSVILMSPEERERAYVIVGNREVFLKDVPKEDREEIISKRRARGLPINEQVIVEAWLKKKAAESK